MCVCVCVVILSLLPTLLFPTPPVCLFLSVYKLSLALLLQVRLMVGRPNGLSHQPSHTATTTDRLLLDTGSVLKVLLDSQATPSTPTKGRCSGEELEGVCVLYMSMEGVDSDDKVQNDDVVYRFPREDGVLSRLRGSFFTLDHLLTDSGHSDIRL